MTSEREPPKAGAIRRSFVSAQFVYSKIRLRIMDRVGQPPALTFSRRCLGAMMGLPITQSSTGAFMTSQDKIARRKLSLLELAQDLNNVSKACKVMGCFRQQFYEITTQLPDLWVTRPHRPVSRGQRLSPQPRR